MIDFPTHTRFLDTTNDFVLWVDNYGRTRRIRRDSFTGKQLVGLMTIVPARTEPKRSIASYDDI